MKKLFYLVSVFTVIALFQSCKTEGCTDKDAINYDPKANEDCSCCEYEGNVIFWYGKTTSQGLVNDDALTLTFYVDGQVVGSSATSVYWTSLPDCGDNGTITVTKKLGNVKSKSYNYTIKDQSGFVYWTGVANFTANTCQSYELTW